MDLYLKGTTRDQLHAALLSSELATKVEGQLVSAVWTSIDEVGEIPGATGWHVNVRTAGLSDEQLAILQPFIITLPDTPYRVWA